MNPPLRPCACPLVVVCAAVFGLCHGSAAAEATGRSEDEQALAFRVQALFAAKCTECHGAAVRRPKGKFGYVLDLGRVAANPHLVVPFEPAASKLWVLVRDDEMPPPYAHAGSLTADEKELVRAWIAAGAPPGPPSLSRPALTQADPGRMSRVRRLFGWLGKFHILLIHFPIALLIAAAFGELLSIWRPGLGLEPAVRFCLLLGASSAVSAMGLGWLHADIGGHGAGSGRVLTLHRWLGTVTALWSVALVLLSERDARRPQRRWLFRVMLGVGTLLVAATGHFGGTMVHGEDFFDL